MRKDEFPIVDKLVKDSVNEVLDKIRAEINEQSKMHMDGDLYIKTSYCMQIIDKYKAESEIHCTYTDSEIAKSFIDDVEAVKDLLPRAESEVSDANSN